MAVDGILISLPCTSGVADLSGALFTFAALDQTGGAEKYAVVPANANTLPTLGVFYGNPSQIGASVQVAVSGIVKVRSGAAIAAGDNVEPDAGGLAVTSAGAGVGIALTTTTAADELVEVLLNR